MTLPATGTIVTYPGGMTTAEARVVHVEALDDGRSAVLLDRTSCHPVDSAWPDQGPDRAVLDAGDIAVELLDCVVGATDGTELFLGSDIPVRKGTEGWAFVVAHIVDADASLAEGDTVTVEVDSGYRAALSAGHSACHLASLALNMALAGAWSKEATLDGLGSPDFDGTAIETSTILENGSRDVYRVGKSARKKGFDPSALDDPAALAATVNATLASWITTGGGMRIERDGDLLTDRRYWVAELPGAPEGGARQACGGTHVTSLADLGPVTVTLTTEQLEGAVGMTMETSAG
ncbi:MAG: metal-dependent hydrolase [Pseudolysinimonas sp.]